RIVREEDNEPQRHRDTEKTEHQDLFRSSLCLCGSISSLAIAGELMPLELADAIAPLEGADKDYLWTLNFGPQHPATHTTLRLVLTLDGETVVRAVPDIGFLHSGFEKLGEHLDFNQYVTIVDRMNYISPVANEIAWHHSVEKLLGVELTPRCKYIRTI